MGLNFFSPQQPQTVDAVLSPATSLEDHERRENIASKIFEKRKAIAWNLANRDASTRHLYTEELSQNTVDMKLLGLSEIDYEVYLAKSKQEIH